jgi:hypothetical protein
MCCVRSRDAGAPFKHRLAHVFVMTFFARNRDGNLVPAYVRFIAIPSSSAFASTWRPESERSVGDLGARIGPGSVGSDGDGCVQRVLARRPPVHLSKKARTSRLGQRAVALSAPRASRPRLESTIIDSFDRLPLLSRFGNHLQRAGSTKHEIGAERALGKLAVNGRLQSELVCRCSLSPHPTSDCNRFEQWFKSRPGSQSNQPFRALTAAECGVTVMDSFARPAEIRFRPSVVPGLTLAGFLAGFTTSLARRVSWLPCGCGNSTASRSLTGGSFPLALFHRRARGRHLVRQLELSPRNYPETAGGSPHATRD